MSQYRYLHLTVNDENNIGVIQCNPFHSSQVEDALSQHFDVDVIIDSIEISSRHPMNIVVKFSYLNFDDELEHNTAYLNETWLY